MALPSPFEIIGGNMKKIKIKFNSPAILLFVIACCVATVLGEVTQGYLTKLLFMNYHSSLFSPLTYLRFFTHVLGHEGFGHLVGNASYLLLLGPMLEEKYGSKVIWQTITITALVTGIINYALFWNQALCGASGVVFAFIILASFTGFRDGEIPITFILVALIFIGQQVYDGLTVKDNVSNLTHIIGGVVGAFIGYGLNKRKKFGY